MLTSQWRSIWRSVFCAVLMLAANQHIVIGHDGEGHSHRESILELRQWKLNNGKSSMRGSFVNFDGESVQIRLASGQNLTLKISRLSALDQTWILTRQWQIDTLNGSNTLIDVKHVVVVDSSEQGRKPDPSIAKHFKHHSDSGSIKTRWDGNWFYVESNGMPAHEMMVGIKAWQQQVPIPQSYKAGNAWQIPLNPVPAKRPMSAKKHFFRGAIALAVNGVPIFNPIKNDGVTDTKVAGELDEFGGHCGRADDYHYHLPPVHLESVIGEGEPIAYALDGYPIYGFQTAAEAKDAPLDWLNGHKDENGTYHYHSTDNYPYLNGGFYAQVRESRGQVEPQPRSEGARPPMRPLRGATITSFSRSENGKEVSLTYRVRNDSCSVGYVTQDFRNYVFEYKDGSGKKTVKTYRLPPSRSRADRGKRTQRGRR